MKTSVLVVGASGFIGANIIKKLNPDKFSLVGVDLQSSALNSSNIKVLKDPESVLEFLEAANFDVIINCVGSANVQASFKNPLLDFQLNTNFFIQMLETIRLKNASARVIQLSSAAVYGSPIHLPISEVEPRLPISPYGFHKAMSEDIATSYYRLYDIPTCSLRLFSVYGPGQKKLLFWDLYLKAVAAAQRKINLFGTGEETRDFIFIDDLMLALELVIEKAPFKGEKMNVASGIEVTISEAAQSFIKYVNANIQIEFNGQIKIGDPRKWLANISLLKSLGFQPKVQLSEGLRQTALSFQQESV